MKALPALALCALAALAPPVLAAPSVTTVMTNLDNPRGLAFGPEGALYVVEAGRGGTGPCAMLRGVNRCYGPSGALTRLWAGKQERIVVGLPSYSDAAGLEVTGPHDVVFHARNHPHISIGWGGDPAERALFGDVGALFGTLVHVNEDRSWRAYADVAALEGANNPAGGPVDSNPYGLIVESGNVNYVTDAGGNDLLRVSPLGAVNAVARFRSRPAAVTDSVPTSVVRGPDGAFYIGELTGAPFTAGTARIYRFAPGSAPTLHLDGFKTIIDMAFGRDRSLYVLQHASSPAGLDGPGQVIRVAPDGVRTVVASGLERPTSIALDRHDVLYVSNRGASILTGEVLRIRP
jgi:hypothetical protein